MTQTSELLSYTDLVSQRENHLGSKCIEKNTHWKTNEILGDTSVWEVQLVPNEVGLRD